MSLPVVGVGASAGGLEAFTELLHALPQKTGMAFVLVQHLDPKHESVLREILARTTKMPVTEVAEGAVVEPDHVYVIPVNTNIGIRQGALQVKARELTRGQHMPIDDFFRSLAEDVGERAIGVILSGTASDGTLGCGAIKAEGGIVFAQDEKSAKYDSMPRSAINSGSVDFVLPPKEIARELARIGQHPYIAPHPPRRKMDQELPAGNNLDTLLFLLTRKSGVDFAHYKHTTLQRRIRRRMVLHKIESLKDYVRFVKKTSGEIDELYRDILIHVTGFFREPQAFEALRKQVYPALFESRKPENPVRIWVPGCSTGEEVYSIAITLLEYLWTQRNVAHANTVIQIFATDISESALERARQGLYTEAAVAEISPERLKRFFVKQDGGYQINKSIRDMCIFAQQNVAKDPPFSNLDLISCRNLLIYLGPMLQRRVVPTLHYALKPTGYLMLGASESLGTFADHFTLIDKKFKIYHKKKTATRLMPYFGNMEYPLRRGGDESRAPREPRTGAGMEREVQQLLLDRFAPASILVNEDMEIVQFHGRTGTYLEPASGRPTFSLSKMAREGLLVDLRAALNEAKRQDTTVRRNDVQFRSDGHTRDVNLEVVPIRGNTPQERFFLVVFQDGARPAEAAAKRGDSRKTAKGQSPLLQENDRMKREVGQLREQLRSLIEEHETTSEEYRSANEEVLSANEELQSTNEELETAKEELQSSNEELTTLNEEMQNRNAELTSANNDLINLLGNVSLPVVMVSEDLRIRRFTPPAQKLLNLLPGDIGRRIGEIRPELEVDDLQPLILESIETVNTLEREVRSKEGGWHLLRVRPYKTWDGKIAGAAISLQDIDEIKRAVDGTYANALIETAREPILILDEQARVIVANPAFYRVFRVVRQETERRPLFELGDGQWNIPKLRELLEEVSQRNGRIDDFEVRHSFPNIGPRVLRLNARALDGQTSHKMILLAFEDVTEREAADSRVKRRGDLLEMVPAALLVRSLDGTIHSWSQGARDLYGWSKEEANGKLNHELLNTKFPGTRAEIEAQLLRAGKWEGKLIHTKRDGTPVPVYSRWSVQREEPGGESLVLEIDFDDAAAAKRK